MCAEIMSVFFQLLNKRLKFFVPVEISCKKERCSYVLLFQCLQNAIAAICKLMTSEDQCQFFLCCIATYNSTSIVTEASCGGVYFFGLLCASIAANK